MDCDAGTLGEYHSCKVSAGCLSDIFLGLSHVFNKALPGIFLEGDSAGKAFPESPPPDFLRAAVEHGRLCASSEFSCRGTEFTGYNGRAIEKTAPTTGC